MAINCRETARLVSERRDRRLSLRERISLLYHMTMCKACKVYSRQMVTLTRIWGEAADHATDSCPGELPKDCKDRIKEAMKRET